MLDIVTHKQWRDLVLDGEIVLIEFYTEKDPESDKAHRIIEKAVSRCNGVEAYKLDTALLKDIATMFANKESSSFMMFQRGIPRTLAKKASTEQEVLDAIEHTKKRT